MLGWLELGLRVRVMFGAVLRDIFRVRVSVNIELWLLERAN